MIAHVDCLVQCEHPGCKRLIPGKATFTALGTIAALRIANASDRETWGVRTSRLSGLAYFCPEHRNRMPSVSESLRREMRADSKPE